LFALALLLAAFTGCGNDGDGMARREPVGDDGAPTASSTPVAGSPVGPGISVAQARRDDVEGPVLVNGYVVVTPNGQVRICAGLRGTRPPRCAPPSLTVRGLAGRDLDDFAPRGRPRRTRWSPDLVQILGAVHADVLRVSENALAQPGG
jgi:hypothetical protein